MDKINVGDVVVLNSDLHSLEQTRMTVMCVHQYNDKDFLTVVFISGNKNVVTLDDVHPEAFTKVSK